MVELMCIAQHSDQEGTGKDYCTALFAIFGPNEVELNLLFLLTYHLHEVLLGYFECIEEVA